ncbi:DUF3152 domain-containing protein [Streptomyces sp. NPDC086010]|uniref:DUF3152 domain-containing protein n=1 Tax=Streptomyces sp. NPDC086010 TaxID=3365745 RepID=UPI0037D1B66C
MQSNDTHHIRTAATPRRRNLPAAPRGQAGGQARRRPSPRVRRRRRFAAVLLLALVAGAAYLMAQPPWRGGGPAVAAGSGDAAPTPAAADRPAPVRIAPDSSPSASPPTAAEVPKSGPGTFTVARAGVTAKGSGSRYRVEVEEGSGVDPDEAAAAVAEILADPRGWNKGGTHAFRQVADGSAGLVIRIGTPATTDRLCGRYGLRTGGELNCRGAKDVMVNLRRWQLGSPEFDGPPAEYRALIINHEVGHWLGHGHETCPGPGRPAPAMMQQIKGLKGCVSNAWPYDAKGRYLGGPSAP